MPLLNRVLVLGATGFIGREITRRLLQDGAYVRGTARRMPTKNASDYLIGSELLIGNVENVQFLDEALKNIDYVVYAIGGSLPAVSNQEPLRTITGALNVLLTLLDALRRLPGVGLTFLSSGGTVYGNAKSSPVDEDSPCHPITAYGISKLTAEHFLGMYSALYDIPVTILRVANAYGPAQASNRGQGIIAVLLQSAYSGTPINIYGDGSVVRDYIHVEDVAYAVVEIMKRNSSGMTLNVASGTGHSIRQLIELTEDITGTDISINWLEERTFDVKEIVLDTFRIRSLLDWMPVCLEDGLKVTWAEYIRIRNAQLS